MVLSCLAGCDAPDEISTAQQPLKTIQASLINLEAASMILIYDYEEEGALLEYRAVKNVQHSGQPLQDIIQTFLSKNHFHNIPTNLQLSTIKKGTPLVLHFANTSGFSSPQDESLFWDALKMTVYRNSEIEQLLIKKS